MLTRLVGRYRLAGDDVAAAVEQVSAKTEGWTAAELEHLVKLARRIARRKRLTGGAALLAAKARLKSATRKVDEMTRLALSICDDLAVVPPDWQAFVAEPVEPVAANGAGPGRPTGPRRSRDL
jgi:hypothetical protein